MSYHQPYDDSANDADPSTDKGDLLRNLSDKRSCVEAVTSGYKAATIEQRTRDEEGGKRSLVDQRRKDDESRLFSDICRICHMGSFSTTDENRASRERQNQPVRRVDSQTSTLSSYAYLGPLISACKCRGTVALVHTECLERWLTESGHSRCELCGYKYATKRVPRHTLFRSVAIWFNTVLVTRQMLLDILYLVVTTPLALFSCYICILALRMLLKRGLQEMPWMVVAMLPTCSLTLIAYWGWIITLARLHGRRWRRYWRSNFVVRLIPDDSIGETNLRQGEIIERQLYQQNYMDDETTEIHHTNSRQSIDLNDTS
ncbi:E3 ubiquitin-protein ligase MARCHF2-like isoform X1 [Frieseomelitta varia]|uniref:E3 ubiquitin-protein ligase MARCHF2-like isoform X1 n=1 Tax=Frieseomelitta varia TaxID=561572 RepID=UPI001CB69466|nr:E3 ubiquitin-protein ligase MARCHF2-like isoform X1 [Frieseomelitta varia]